MFFAWPRGLKNGARAVLWPSLQPGVAQNLGNKEKTALSLGGGGGATFFILIKFVPNIKSEIVWGDFWPGKIENLRKWIPLLEMGLLC